MSGYIGFGNGRSGIRIVPGVGANQRSGVRFDSTGSTFSGDIYAQGGLYVGRDFTNEGKFKLNGILKVKENLKNSGEMSINDTEKGKQIALEATKTIGQIAELGTQILKKF